MKKLGRGELVIAFLAKYPEASFSQVHREIIGSLLTKRDALGKLPLTEEVELASQEDAGPGCACNIELSRQGHFKVFVKIASPDGVDTLVIKSELTLEKIAEVLRMSNGLDKFMVRVNSQAEKEVLRPEVSGLKDITRLWAQGV